ncbi:hypothetical protein OEZ86_009542 [Tetradesmus obliquus]|nr:hypothetical protein OEZ86_009542 [Tetradesmus obliquus]
MAHVSAEEAYYVVLRTVVAGKQTNWAVMGHMAQLRQLMGVSDDLHKQYMEQIQADPHVCAINGSQPPAPKRQRTSAPPAPAATAAAARPAVQQKPKPKPPSRLSEPGYAAPLPPAPPPAPVVTYGLPNRMAPHEDPHRLVGQRVAITQEDDSTLEGMVVDYNAADGTHFVICNLGMPDEAGDALPLVEYPDACQILGPHPDYVSPIPPAPAAHVSMPPPAARPRTSSYSGAAGGGSASKQKQRKPPTVRTGGAAGGGASGAVRLGAPPYSAAGLEARLAVADIPELANMLSAISRKERSIMAELEAAGLMDEELSRSVMEREELVRQVCAAH